MECIHTQQWIDPKDKEPKSMFDYGTMYYIKNS
jgi:hypothetical protein